MKILIVDDEEKLLQNLKGALESEGSTVRTATTGEEGFLLATTVSFDLIILDYQLPGHSGIDILKALRKAKIKTPVIMLTARDSLEDKLEGLNSGADDYIIKPFAFAELSARIRSLFRRSRPDQPLQIKCENLVLNLITRKVHRNGKQLEIAQREFQLLEYFLRNQGNVITREMLARDIWNEPKDNQTIDNIIDVYIARLRKKVDTEGQIKLIATIRGVGFMFGTLKNNS